SMPVTVMVNGDRLGEGDEYFFVNLSGATHAVIVDGQGMGTITNDEPRMTVMPVSQVEGDSGTTEMVFAATLSAPSDATVTVDWATGDWTAVAGEDYVAASGTLTFAPNQTTHLFTVPVKGDQGIEYDESFLVNFSNVNGAVLDSDHTWGTILNDDGSIISVSDGAAWEGSPGDLTYIPFTVSLSTPATETFTVDYTTVDGSATAGLDYMPVSGTLTFNPGDTTQTVWVQVLGDYDYEGDETFSLVLSNNTGNTLIKPGGGTGTIWDDDYYYDPGYYDPGYYYYF
ncbi:MAG TPA: Calx-beta domain-containing protein, partial [Gemmataceae bacterium]|nr:Calx-beta domain-containing protein [Gemmataceae bacterium]